MIQLIIKDAKDLKTTLFLGFDTAFYEHFLSITNLANSYLDIIPPVPDICRNCH